MDLADVNPIGVISLVTWGPGSGQRRMLYLSFTGTSETATLSSSQSSLGCRERNPCACKAVEAKRHPSTTWTTMLKLGLTVEATVPEEGT